MDGPPGPRGRVRWGAPVPARVPHPPGRRAPGRSTSRPLATPLPWRHAGAPTRQPPRTVPGGLPRSPDVRSSPAVLGAPLRGAPPRRGIPARRGPRERAGFSSWPSPASRVGPSHLPTPFAVNSPLPSQVDVLPQWNRNGPSRPPPVGDREPGVLGRRRRDALATQGLLDRGQGDRQVPAERVPEPARRTVDEKLRQERRVGALEHQPAQEAIQIARRGHVVHLCTIGRKRTEGRVTAGSLISRAPAGGAPPQFVWDPPNAESSPDVSAPVGQVSRKRACAARPAAGMLPGVTALSTGPAGIHPGGSGRHAATQRRADAVHPCLRVLRLPGLDEHKSRDGPPGHEPADGRPLSGRPCQSASRHGREGAIRRGAPRG